MYCGQAGRLKSVRAEMPGAFTCPASTLVITSGLSGSPFQHGFFSLAEHSKLRIFSCVCSTRL